jgi:hypothetical protein
MVFYINFPAEEEAGIRGGSATATFDDGLTYDDVMIQGMKEFLSEWYDVTIDNINTEGDRRGIDAIRRIESKASAL